MSHNARIYPDSYYRNGTPVPASYFQALDTAQASAVDADGGGTWMPSAPIVIGGAGLTIAAPAYLSGGATIRTGPGAPIVFAANDAISLDASSVLSQRSITTWLAGEATVMSPRAGQISDDGKGTLAMLTGLGEGTRWLCPLRVQDLGTFASISISISMATHAAVPQQPPQMRVYALDVFGDIFPIGTAGIGGWQSTRAVATGAAFSAITSIDYQIPAGIVVNRSVFSYHVEIVDAYDGVGGNRFGGVTCNFANIPWLGVE